MAVNTTLAPFFAAAKSGRSNCSDSAVTFAVSPLVSVAMSEYEGRRRAVDHERKRRRVELERSGRANANAFAANRYPRTT